MSLIPKNSVKIQFPDTDKNQRAWVGSEGNHGRSGWLKDGKAAGDDLQALPLRLEWFVNQKPSAIKGHG